MAGQLPLPGNGDITFPSYELGEMLAITPPPPPPDYPEFWLRRYHRALHTAPKPRLRDRGVDVGPWRVFDLKYHSTDEAIIRGWFLIPQKGPVRRGFVIGHGYGPRLAPDYHLPLEDSALLFLCCRGLGRSPHPTVSPEVRWHVLHHIQDRERYVHGGCVEDTWMAVSVLLRLQPQMEGRIGYLGTSFGGGIGAMALAWDARLQMAFLGLPSFGHHPLRLLLPSTGSARSVQEFAASHPHVRDTLAYFDSAIAAGRVRQPVLTACALCDPMVPPPGQFAVHNALAGKKELVVLTAGHREYPGQEAEEAGLLATIGRFFAGL